MGKGKVGNDTKNNWLCKDEIKEQLLGKNGKKTEWEDLDEKDDKDEKSEDTTIIIKEYEEIIRI